MPDTTIESERRWDIQPGDRFIPYRTSVWMNENDFGFNYHVLEQATTLQRAIKCGLAANGSDDFNIGVIRDGRMVAVLWMENDIDEEPDVIDHVGRELGVHR